MGLETQTAKINAVIMFKKKQYTNDVCASLKNWCETNCKMYAFILHDRDILEDGSKKSTHLHLVAILNGSRCRLSTTLNALSSVTGVDSFGIQIEKMQDFEGSLQYLIHKNNYDKYQYDVKDIVTNIEASEFNVYLHSEGGGISLETLVAIVKKNRSMVDIMREIGLGNYRVYRNVIWDIYSEIWLQAC